MKTKLFILFAVIISGLFFLETKKSMVDPLVQENVDALTQGEAIITCNQDDWGYCHVIEYTQYLGGLYIYYHCRWTGVQADYCPFSIYLLN